MKKRSTNMYPKILLEEVNEGFVLIDTLLTKELSEEVKKDFNRITGLDKEVIAVFYTHWHADHWAGVKAWITEEDAQSGKVDVIAQDLFEGGLIAENLISGVAMGRRAQYMYATSIGHDELGQLETGLGSCRGFDGSPTLVLPTETFDSLHLIISMITKIPEYLYTLLEVQKREPQKIGR